MEKGRFSASRGIVAGSELNIIKTSIKSAMKVITNKGLIIC